MAGASFCAPFWKKLEPCRQQASACVAFEALWRPRFSMRTAQLRPPGSARRNWRSYGPAIYAVAEAVPCGPAPNSSAAAASVLVAVDYAIVPPPCRRNICLQQQKMRSCVGSGPSIWMLEQLYEYRLVNRPNSACTAISLAGMASQRSQVIGSCRLSVRIQLRILARNPAHKSVADYANDVA